jgi:hypothetical protein
MVPLLFLFLNLLISVLKPTGQLEAENAALWHQVAILRGRIEFTNGDRLFFILLYRLFPSVLKAMKIVQPETVVCWHRAGFRCYWRWKSQRLGGRPPISAELRTLIRQMSVENVLWGAPRIQGELLKLGFAVAQSTFASIWPSETIRAVRVGAHSCATMRRRSRRWICLWFQPSALFSSMSW